MSGIKRCEATLEKVRKFYEDNGYLPEFYNPYNNVEITDITPTLTANCDRITNSATVLVFENELKGSDNLTKINEVKVEDIFEGKPFNYVSLFSGIGGFEQALNKLGGTCVLASEIDKFANQAYEALYGEPTAGDITKIDAKDVPDHDLLVGGFPCQAFSVAGKRLGFEDTRGTLFFEVARIAREKQPKVVLLENVKGLVGHDKGRTLDTIVQTLNDIGYTVDFEVLNSKYFGVPQNRERIFIVAVRDDLIETEPWVIEGNTVVPKGKRRISEYEGVKTFNFDWPEQETVSTRLRDILETEVDEMYYLDEEKTAKLVEQLNDGAGLGKDGELGTLVNGVNISPCIDANYAKGIAPSGIGKGRRTHVAETYALTERRTEDAKRIRKEYREKYGVDFSPRRGKQVVPREDGMANCLTATQSIEQTLLEVPKYRIRKLTPLECWRLQGFSDETFNKAKYYSKKEAEELLRKYPNHRGKRKFTRGERIERISNSQLYKMAGNAVTVSVVKAISERLLKYL